MGEYMPANISGNDNERRLTEDEIIYIRQILGQLRRLSDKEGTEILCYLIDMAYLEAGEVQSQLITNVRGK